MLLATVLRGFISGLGYLVRPLDGFAIYGRQIKRVNFLGSDIAQYQTGIIRPQPAPGSNVGDRQTDSSQIDDALQLVVADPYSVEHRIASEGVEINILPVPRPVGEGGRKISQFKPFLS